MASYHAPMGDEREVLTWPQFGEATEVLARKVAQSGFRPDIVLAIARGGLTVGGALAYALSVKNCGAVNVEYYTDVDQRLDVPLLLPPALDLAEIRGSKVLVADTGHTLALVQRVVAGSVDEVRTAVLYHKPHSVVVPSFCWRTTDRWIEFPWSSGTPVVSADGTLAAGTS